MVTAPKSAREDIERRDSCVELATSMVGKDHPIGAGRDATLSVVGTEDALHQQLARPELAQPVEVVQAEAGIHLSVHHGGLHLDIRGIGGHEVPKRRHAIEQKAEQPPRMREAVI